MPKRAAGKGESAASQEAPRDGKAAPAPAKPSKAKAKTGGHRPKLVLASASPRRLGLLEQAGITPDALRPANVDESAKRGEAPRHLCRRLARAKAEAIQKALRSEPEFENSFILAADTVVAVGKRILVKAEKEHEATRCLELLSGRSHRVYSAICLITPSGRYRERVVETRVRFKRLTRAEIEAYIATGQWRGKAGGYGVQGVAGSFVVKLVGSYTNVVGLPLYETLNLLSGEDFPITYFWLNRVEVETA
ncbi:MAG: Maf-like protein [Methyloligella sp. ZOD6]